jgi:hypothetical protein
MREIRSKVLCLMLCCLAPVMGGGQAVTANGRLIGTVTELPEGQPVTKAAIYIHSFRNEGDMTTKVDSQGKFVVSLAPGVYDIFVAAPVFAPTCKAIRILPGKTTDVSLKMDFDVENSER